MAPTSAQVLIGTVSVVLACLGLAAAGRAALGGHRLWFVGAAGCLLVIVGVVGQRSFPSADLVGRLGKDQASRQVPGPWDAGVSIPLVGLQVTPVALVGLLLAVAGTSLVLFFEPPESGGDPAAVRLPPLEEDDAV